MNKDELVYQYMLYDHIEYNGTAYYIADNQSYQPSKNGEMRSPIYLVCKSSKINYEKCNEAYVHTGYEGEEDEIYLFFDSALYIRGDYIDNSPAFLSLPIKKRVKE
jgi:hypothetical protein